MGVASLTTVRTFHGAVPLGTKGPDPACAGRNNITRMGLTALIRLPRAGPLEPWLPRRCGRWRYVRTDHKKIAVKTAPTSDTSKRPVATCHCSRSAVGLSGKSNPTRSSWLKYVW